MRIGEEVDDVGGSALITFGEEEEREERSALISFLDEGEGRGVSVSIVLERPLL